MQQLLLTNPTTFINNAAHFSAAFVIFCATTLGTLTILWALYYVLFRPIPRRDIFAPFENLSFRIFNLLVLFISVMGAYGASVALKNYFQIGRPVILNFDLHPLLTLSDYGFPSSHAAFFSALAAALFFIHKKAGIFAGMLALIIGAARIFAGVHTPLDILGGYLLGCGISALVAYFSRMIQEK